MKPEYQTTVRRTGYGLFATSLAEIAGGIASATLNSEINDQTIDNIRTITFKSGIDYTNAGLIIAGMVSLIASTIILTYSPVPSQRNYIGNLEGGLN